MLDLHQDLAQNLARVKKALLLVVMKQASLSQALGALPDDAWGQHLKVKLGKAVADATTLQQTLTSLLATHEGVQHIKDVLAKCASQVQDWDKMLTSATV